MLKPSAAGSVIYSERNYFYKTNQSNQVGLDSSSHTYTFYERNNYYNQTTGTSATGAAFPSSLLFPYSYSLNAVLDVPNIVQANAGPH
ncbi:hypothetical protein [Paenibacillus algorifonticola]|uniref:hypothetical protein n=1 Tax=Paenibacillus algorifonticola TaxID=684063 RepID=UPI000619E0E9|nr:hypothetical protein [Paenibacillus algorifonticola]